MIFDEIVEGQTPLDPNEASELIPGHLKAISELNEYESWNILKAEKKYLQASRKNWPLEDPEFLKKVHFSMFDLTWKWAGTYRLSNKNIGKDWPQIPVEMRKVCDDFRYWKLNGVYDADEIAVRFHHRLVSIHPFPNGNGRHARLIADIFLRGQGLGSFSWGSGKLYAKTPDRGIYIEALREADSNDFSLLLKFARG